MQVQELKKIQNFQPAIAEFGHLSSLTFIPHANLLAKGPITIGVNAQTTDLHLAQVQALTTLADQLATLLADTLHVLKAYNETAINPIISILEPYMEETLDVDFSFPPKSSQDVTIKVINKGRVTPIISLGDAL